MAKKLTNKDREQIDDLTRQKKALDKTIKRLKKEERKRQKDAENEDKLRKQHKIIPSTQMSIPIQDILRSIIITKDQRYLKIMEFAPLNFLMNSNADRNNISMAFEQMLRIVPHKIQFKVFSRSAKTDSLLETTKKAYETEENEACRLMQEEYMSLIEDTALREGVTRRCLVILEYSNDIIADGTDFNKIVSSLNSTAQRLRNHLERAGNTFIPSCETDQGVTELLYDILCRSESTVKPFSVKAAEVWKRYSQWYKENNTDSEIIIPAAEFISPGWIDYKHPRHIVVDGKFYTFGYFAAESYPCYAYAGWLSRYINACEGVDVDIFFETVPSEKILPTIGRSIRNNRAKLKETSDTSSEAYDVSNLIQSGNYLLQGLTGGENFFYANTIITVTGDSLDEMNYRYNELEHMAKSEGYILRRPLFQMETVFESVLPLCQIKGDIKRKSRRNMLTSGASSFYPFISFELQDPNGIMLGVNKGNNSLVAVDVFDTKRHANANGAILGKSGYGKTFTAQLLAIRMRLQNIQTFIITPLKGKEDYKRACDQIDGQYIALGPGSPYYINIFDIHIPDTEGLELLEEGSTETSLLAKKVQDLHTFFHLIIEDMTQEEEQVLDGYIYKLYNEFGITEDNSSLFIDGTQEYKQFPVLGDLHESIKGNAILSKIYNIMIPYVSGSLSAYNHQTNVDLSNKYIVFDLNGAQGSNLILSMFVTLDFVWSKIKENRLAKKAVFIDEAWRLIGSGSNEMAAEYVKEIFKVIRAFGGSAFVMTQEISDFFSLKGGEYGKAIIGNSDTKICLHLDKIEADMVQDIMSLSPEEHKQIMNLSRGVGLVSTGSNKLFVEFKASDFETEVITTDPEFLRKKVNERKKITQIR